MRDNLHIAQYATWKSTGLDSRRRVTLQSDQASTRVKLFSSNSIIDTTFVTFDKGLSRLPCVDTGHDSECCTGPATVRSLVAERRREAVVRRLFVSTRSKRSVSYVRDVQNDYALRCGQPAVRFDDRKPASPKATQPRASISSGGGGSCHTRAQCTTVLQCCDIAWQTSYHSCLGSADGFKKVGQHP